MSVNDTDLYPEMTEPPRERLGATDVLFCRLRHNIFNIMSQLNLNAMVGGENRPLPLSEVERSLYDKDKLLDELERKMELSVLRYCDLLQPVHYLTTIVARLVLCRVRFTIHHPRQYFRAGHLIPESEQEYLFTMALRVLEYDNMAHEQPTLKRFFWHLDTHFQWPCLVHVVGELKTRTYGVDADKAWEEVGKTFAHRSFMTAK